MSAGRRKTYHCPNCGANVETQQTYVRHLLEEAGDKGVTTNEFLRWGAGSRFGARVHELRHEYGLYITEENGLYTLVGVAAAHAASSSPEGERPRATGGDRRETYGDLYARLPEVCFDSWQRVLMCPHCAYQVVAEATCPRGHRPVLGWHLNLVSATGDVELAEAA